MKDHQKTQDWFVLDNLVAGMERNDMPSSEQIQRAARELEWSPAYLQARLRQGSAHNPHQPAHSSYGSHGTHPAATCHAGQQQRIDAHDDMAIELILPKLEDTYDEVMTGCDMANPHPYMYPGVQSVLPADDASGRAEDVPAGFPRTYTDAQGTVLTELTSSSDASWVCLTPEPPAMEQQPQDVKPYQDSACRVESWPSPMGLTNPITLTPRPKRGRKPKGRRVGRNSSSIPRTTVPCYACRRAKTKCNDGRLCRSCVSWGRGPLETRQLCLRYTVSDAALYRVQKQPVQRYSQRWGTMDIVDIDSRDWASNDTLTIQISQTFFNAPITLRLRKFKPNGSDVTFTSWWDGASMQRYEMPPYAIADLSEAAKAYGDAIDQYVYYFVFGAIHGYDTLIKDTYSAALMHAQETPIEKEKRFIIEVFRFWVACRITSNPAQIVGAEKLGLNPINDKTSRMHGMVPLPPIITPQEQVIIYSQFLIPLSRKIVDQLDTFLKDANPRIWYTAYLGLFIILHSCSMLTRRNEEYAREIAHKDKYANPESISRLQSGAITMLAHFHANNGTRLFDPGNVLRAQLDQHQIQVLTQTSILVKEKRVTGAFSRLRAEKMLSDDLYWVSQLYDEDWVPDLQP